MQFKNFYILEGILPEDTWIYMLVIPEDKEKS